MKRKISALKRIIPLLNAQWRECRLCPRECRVDRTAGETGFCGLGTGLRIARALPHFGEEPPISGERGAGTLFFSSCNLRCRFCQNHQISHSRMGGPATASEAARLMLELENQGCQNIEFVTPTPQLPAILEALLLACEQGLEIPVVYNCGGYERKEIIQLLAGIIDVYLPDFKYGNADTGTRCAGVADYPEQALAAIAEMIRQRGDRLDADGGVAVSGVIVRHLVLPRRTRNSLDALRLLSTLSTTVPLSLMSQYTPIPAVSSDPDLGRRITQAEYEDVLREAERLEFETIYVQDVDDRNLVPDFDLEEPFEWKK